MQYNQNEYEVEKIIDKRRVNNINEYFVKWKNFDSSENTWEPFYNFKDSWHLLIAFEKKLNEKENLFKRKNKKQNQRKKINIEKDLIMEKILSEKIEIPKKILEIKKYENEYWIYIIMKSGNNNWIKTKIFKNFYIDMIIDFYEKITFINDLN